MTLAIGIDLGGTQVRAALVDAAGAVVSRAADATDVLGGPARVLEQMRRLVAEVSAGVSHDDIEAAGVCAPGPLDSETGTVLDIPTLPGWRDVPLRDALSDTLKMPVVLENDGIAAAFGEWKYGAGRGLRHMVYVTVSTGIGGGVVVDGRLLHGRRGMAAHVGHMPIDLTGPICSCGGVGCFEALAAGPALGRAGRAMAERGGLLAALTEPVEARQVVEAARMGDTGAMRLIELEAEYLGVGFTGLIHLFSPERVIMGGGVSTAFDLLDAGIHAVIRGRAMPAFRDVTVVRAALGDNSGLIGAAAMALSREARD